MISSRQSNASPGILGWAASTSSCMKACGPQYWHAAHAWSRPPYHIPSRGVWRIINPVGQLHRCEHVDKVRAVAGHEDMLARALQGYVHAFVNHTRKEYARGDVHENRAECLFSLLKPYLRVFRGVSKFNLPGD